MPTAAAPDQRSVCITHVATNDYRHSFAEICHLLGSVGGRLGFRCSVRPRSPRAGDTLVDPAASVNVLLGHLPFTADRLLPLVRGWRYVVYQLESLSPGNPLFEQFPAYGDLLRGAAPSPPVRPGRGSPRPWPPPLPGTTQRSLDRRPRTMPNSAVRSSPDGDGEGEGPPWPHPASPPSTPCWATARCG